MVLKLGKLILSHEKSVMSTVDEVPERFPVKIAFTRKLNDDEMLQLGIYATLIETGYSTESKRSDSQDEHTMSDADAGADAAGEAATRGGSP